MTTLNGMSPTVHSNAKFWTVVSLAVCLLGVAGSLWLSMGMNLKACPLCLYQRTFVMAVAGVLITGIFTRYCCSSILLLVALPAAAGGLGVAAFHEWLEVTGVLECPAGIFGAGSAPQQSLGMFVVLTIALLLGVCQGKGERGFGPPAIAAAIVAGLLFAMGAVPSAPPMPPAPTTPYEKPLDICRPPYHSQQ